MERTFIERICDKVFGLYALQEIDGAWILDVNANIDLWFNFDKWCGWLPSLICKNSDNQEDIDFQWGWLWIGYSRRHKGWKPKKVGDDETMDEHGETG